MARPYEVYDPNNPMSPRPVQDVVKTVAIPQPAVLDLAEICFDRSTTILNTSTLIMAANKQRTGCSIVNVSDTLIFLQIGFDAAVNAGIPLYPNGGAFEMGKDTLRKGAIFGISSVTTKIVAATEWETKYVD